MIFQPNQSKKQEETTETKAMKERLAPFCKVSNLAIEGDPKTNKNYRNNPSLVIAFDDNGVQKHVLIDCGKTFREGALRWFPTLGINSLDAVVLTHEHADAAFGLDDVRGFQRTEGGFAGNSQFRQVPMPLYVSQQCLNEIAERFPWLFPELQSRADIAPVDKAVVKRHVASLDVHVMEPFKAVNIEGLEIIPLPVMHGEDLVSFGYAFTVGQTNVVYLSDISRMLPETLAFISKSRPPTDILVVDALHPTRDNPVHFSLNYALNLVNEIKPRRTFVVGMNCDSFLPHDQANKDLRDSYVNIQLAYDGQVVEC
jgi:phosphoribosyl 1,2-cyclic phosphodiesterase